IKIKKLFQKKEQEIVGILEKFKNRVFKKDQAVTKYLGIQYVELICIIREIIEEYDYIQHKIAQAQIVKDMLLQLEYSTHDYGMKELQATINRDESAYHPCKHKLEARELQEKIVKIKRTTHLLERENPTDIEMSKKEEVSSIIADVTNKIEVLQDSLQSMLIQEENKESYPTKVDYLIYDKARKNISASRWALCNKVKFTSTIQTQVIQEITTITNQSCSSQKPAITITIWDLPEDAKVQKI
ncbi:39981_t:CDS:2, partial [Gigaspora margarita]